MKNTTTQRNKHTQLNIIKIPSYHDIVKWHSACKWRFCPCY